MDRLVCGVGLNDAKYPVTRKDENGKIFWRCPYYKTWANMLTRCYKGQELYPSYKKSYVCDAWLIFSNFRMWMEQQDWIGNALDKDLLSDGSDVYSELTCTFLPKAVNNFLVSRQPQRGDCLLGVRYHKGIEKFTAQCSDGTGKAKYFGCYENEMDAHFAYLKAKSNLLKTLIKGVGPNEKLHVALKLLNDRLDYAISNRIVIDKLGGCNENLG